MKEKNYCRERRKKKTDDTLTQNQDLSDLTHDNKDDDDDNDDDKRKGR